MTDGSGIRGGRHPCMPVMATGHGMPARGRGPFRGDHHLRPPAVRGGRAPSGFLVKVYSQGAVLRCPPPFRVFGGDQGRCRRKLGVACISANERAEVVPEPPVAAPTKRPPIPLPPPGIVVAMVRTGVTPDEALIQGGAVRVATWVDRFERRLPGPTATRPTSSQGSWVCCGARGWWSLQNGAVTET